MKDGLIIRLIYLFYYSHYSHYSHYSSRLSNLLFDGSPAEDPTKSNNLLIGNPHHTPNKIIKTIISRKTIIF